MPCAVYTNLNYSRPRCFGVMISLLCIHACSAWSEKGTRSHYRGLWATMWLLEIELGTSGGAVSALNHGAISPTPVQTSTHPHLSSSRRSKTKSSPLLKSWFRLGVRHQHSTLKGLRGNGVIGTKQQEVDFSLLRVTNSWKNGTHLTRCSVKLYYLLALGSCTDVVHQIWLLPTAELGQPPASASLWSICPQLWVGADGKHWLVINYLCLGV